MSDPISRVDDGDIQSRLARQQARRHRDPCRATTDDDHLVRRVGYIEWGGIALVDSAHQRAQVVTRLFGAGQYLFGGHTAGTREPPQRGAAHAAAAIGQHGLGQIFEKTVEFVSLGIGHLARNHRQMASHDARSLCLLFDLSETGLVAGFPVRTIADDGFEAGRSNLCHIGRHDLGRDGQVGRQLLDVHEMSP